MKNDENVQDEGGKMLCSSQSLGRINRRTKTQKLQWGSRMYIDIGKDSFLVSRGKIPNGTWFS